MAKVTVLAQQEKDPESIPFLTLELTKPETLRLLQILDRPGGEGYSRCVHDGVIYVPRLGDGQLRDQLHDALREV